MDMLNINDKYMTQLQKIRLASTKLGIITILLISTSAISRTKDVDKVLLIQQEISRFYELGYNKASPVDMDFIEKKVAEAKIAQKKRRKKEVNKLLEQIKIDLKIVEMRYKVNQLNEELSELKNQNLLNENTLKDLKEQIK
jgi:hypothetical protein